jgi:hypothetical protein
VAITRDDDENRTAELSHGISVQQTKPPGAEWWQPARVRSPATQPMSVEEAMEFGLAVLAAATLAEQWTKERPAEPPQPTRSDWLAALKVGDEVAIWEWMGEKRSGPKRRKTAPVKKVTPKRLFVNGMWFRREDGQGAFDFEHYDLLPVECRTYGEPRGGPSS